MSPAAGASCLWLWSAEQTAQSQGEEPAARVERVMSTCEGRGSGEGRSHGSGLAAEPQSCPGLPPMMTLHLTKPSDKRKHNWATPTLMVREWMHVSGCLPERRPAECLTASQCEFSSPACQSRHYHSAPERKRARWSTYTRRKNLTDH